MRGTIICESVFGREVVTFPERPDEGTLSAMCRVWESNGYRKESSGYDPDGSWYVTLARTVQVRRV